MSLLDPETQRLDEDTKRTHNWKRWGPYLAERQWATVREDYSAQGDCWEYFTHEDAPKRAYRWGEDGLLGFTDRQCRLCFAIALWNGRDARLKERLFGLTNAEGNHGEDVKEWYAYEDATPTYSYASAVYRYPQRAFPYEDLRRENKRRGRGESEYDLADTGVFDEDRFFDVRAEYAKASPDDILVRITVTNHGPERASLDVLPTAWFRNTWSWGRRGEDYHPRGTLRARGDGSVLVEHNALGRYVLAAEPADRGAPVTWLFTENESNLEALYRGAKNRTPYVKDAFHRYVIERDHAAVNPEGEGSKCAALFRVELDPGQSATVRVRLRPERDDDGARFDEHFDALFERRINEADRFYEARIPREATDEEKRVARAAYAGLLWSKQFYYYVGSEWLEGDPAHPAPPASRKKGRNRGWENLHCRDVLSMPDKWEYPWFAAWDLAFHMVPFARIDAEFARQQLLLLTREWYMHPNGQLPAYEFNFGDVNPPVHGWAALQVYRIAASRGDRDRLFLERVFHKLLLNFTWWVNRKDHDGNNLFSGGFLGLDNIGVFDRSKPLPVGGHLAQADGSAWMAFYCATMLDIALELAREDSAYEDVASKFFEHFVAITDAMHTHDAGLWDERDGFYYDRLVDDAGPSHWLRVRSMVGIIPLFAVTLIEQRVIDRLPGFARRMRWFLDNRADLARHISYMTPREGASGAVRLLAVPTRERLVSVLRYVLDEREFLSPYGVRSLSRVHLERPYEFRVGSEVFRVKYVPGESDTGLFGGNSNWRGPIWFPVNYLLTEALKRYYRFYGDALKVECPTGSGVYMDLREVAEELSRRLHAVFIPGPDGRRPCHGENPVYGSHPLFAKHPAFYEYFDGDTGRGCGAEHQTGWTALAVRLVEEIAKARAREHAAR